MGAVGGCKPPHATKAIRPNPVPTLPLWPKVFQTKLTNQLERAEEKRKQTNALNRPSPKQPVDKREKKMKGEDRERPVF
jgi:hypothetical protein